MHTFALRMGLVAAMGLIGFRTLASRCDECADQQPDKELIGWTTEFGEDKADLMHTGRNPYFILEPGHFLTLEKGNQRVTKTVLNDTKVVDGIETRVLEEREWEGGMLIEVSRNFYVISKRTNSVYYFGEEVDIYKDGKITSHAGSWLSGAKGAKYGLMMPGTPLVKGRFYQEIAPGDAMDRAEVVSVTEMVKTPAGMFKNCVKMEETTPLEPGKGYKTYAPGVGCVDDGELILVDHGFLKKGKGE